MGNKEITQEDKQIIDELILEVLDDEYPRSTDDVVKYVQAYKDNATSSSIGVQLSRLCKRGLLCNLSKQGRKGYYVRCRRPGYLAETLHVLRADLTDLSEYLSGACEREDKQLLLLNYKMREVLHELDTKIKPILDILNKLDLDKTINETLLEAERAELKHREDYFMQALRNASDGDTLYDSCLSDKPIKVSQDSIDYANAVASGMIINIYDALNAIAAKETKRFNPYAFDVDCMHPEIPPYRPEDVESVNFPSSNNDLNDEFPTDPDFDILAGEVVNYDPFVNEDASDDILLNPDFGTNVDPLDEPGILDDNSYDPNDPLLDPDDNV